MNQTLLKKCVAELNGTISVICIGAGAFFSDSAIASIGLFGVALEITLAIAVMVCATWGYRGSFWFKAFRECGGGQNV